ncbi:MAG: phosphoenolpyruvate carboxylase [Deferrisomatales bacterium]|nr:phosphoenolpyruvate carboxylase [Deferrisomatales bacterium]
MYNRPELSDEDLALLVPHTMGTQHPDNVGRVPFGPSPRVDRNLEEEEVLHNVTVLGLRELMIDYEKKRGGCTPLWDWLHKCPTCLEERVIGRDFHVTPRLPNPDTDRDDPYFWQSLGIFSNSLLVMRRLGLPWLAFSEFILPDVTSGATVARVERHIQERFRLDAAQYRAYGDGNDFPFAGDFFVQGIPLIETVEALLEPERIWDDLVRARWELSGVETRVQRSFIARSDPALKAGLVAALVAATVALHKGRAYERRTGVRIPQIVGIGSAPFRGGLTPDPASIEVVAKTYPGAATLTVQSAFRYDHPEHDVRRAAAEIEGRLARGWVARHRGAPGPDARETDVLKRVVARLKAAYEDSYRELLPLVTRVAPSVPSHRERYENVGVTGEVRRVGGLPAVRAIKYAASCYTLGLPPGILGFRAWENLSEGERALVERTCPTLGHWLREELRLSSPDTVRRLLSREGLSLCSRDLAAATAYAGRVAPDSRHAEACARAAAAVGDRAALEEAVLEAASLRRFLG